jgi:hypothetical protein
VIPQDAEVANAVGTVNGKVQERVKILVKPGESGGYFVYTTEERRIFRDLDNALEYGEQCGRHRAESLAEISGARSIEVNVERRDKYGSLTGGSDEDRIFIESVLVVTASGNPW